MFSSPRVIAIDDESKHLESLTIELARFGTACLPIHFTGEPVNILPCPNVRVIFADLHLITHTPGDHAQDFSAIGGLIEDTIKPTGPYIIVLWTNYPEKADELDGYLKTGLQSVTKPFTVRALDKNDHLNDKGHVKDPEYLIGAIRTIIGEQPQVGALLSWEDRVLDAAADTASSIMDFAELIDTEEDQKEVVARLLANLAVQAVGRTHVEDDRFRGVNKALLPILADRVSSMRSRETDSDLWRAAFNLPERGPRLSLSEAAKLNRLLHIAPSTEGTKGSDRGAVITLPDDYCGVAFTDNFGLSEENAAWKQFWCDGFSANGDRHRWVLVQTQAACDYVQRRPGPLPFYLGLRLPVQDARRDKLPDALWTSPCFRLNNRDWILHVNGRFQVSLGSQKAANERPLFRLREQLLNALIYRIHSYGARPGFISFRES